jgi:hypothetical protein
MKSVTFTGACANEIIPSINRSFVYKGKEGRHVKIYNKPLSSQCNLFAETEQVQDQICYHVHSFEYANVHINYRLPIKVYYRICTLRHIRIEINHGSQNVF